jgi:toxin-antitoxin system PIN domain toxin
MILPDVNVLIYAFRKDMPQHAVCHPWFDSIISGDARFGISPLVLGAVIRITTDSRIYVQPSPKDEVFRFCDDLLDRAHCRLVEPGERHWDIFRRLCIETDTRGRRVTDAWYAALAIEWGCEWITLDRDYARFPGLKWHAPNVPAR